MANKFLIITFLEVSSGDFEDISSKSPEDTSRKVIIRNLFAIKFYKDAYENLLENLRKLNIISEDKIDFGTFQQAILNSLEKAKEKHGRRYTSNLKKINALNKNENDVKLGLRKGDSAFKRDMNQIYKSNRDSFTMQKFQEGFSFYENFFNEFNEATPSDTNNVEQKEDNTVRINDYVWWVNSNQLQNVLTNPNERSQLKYEKQPIEFVDNGTGKFIDGTSASVKYTGGPKKGEVEKIDVRNLDIPQEIAKKLIGFGKVIGDASQQKIIADLDKKIADAQKQLQTPKITSKDVKDITAELEKFKKERQLISNKSDFTTARVQKFIPKDINSLDKTIAGGKTKITPDPSGKIEEVPTNDLVKLNKDGKSKLLSVIGKASVVLYSIFSLLSGKELSTILHGIDKGLGDLAKRFGDLAGSRSNTNF